VRTISEEKLAERLKLEAGDGLFAPAPAKPHFLALPRRSALLATLQLTYSGLPEGECGTAKVCPC